LKFRIFYPGILRKAGFPAERKEQKKCREGNHLQEFVKAEYFIIIRESGGKFTLCEGDGKNGFYGAYSIL